MEDQIQIYCPKTASSNLAMHRNSRTISKTKQKIRIIHIFAPEIIKTDAANFRELVQRLTGKPEKTKGFRKKDARILASSKEEFWMSGNSGGDEFLGGFDEINHFKFLGGSSVCNLLD